MPSGKLIAWIAAISIAVNLGLEHYKASKG